MSLALLSLCGSLELDVVCGTSVLFVFQAEDGIRYLVRSRGLGDVYKRQRLVGDVRDCGRGWVLPHSAARPDAPGRRRGRLHLSLIHILTLPTSDLV